MKTIFKSLGIIIASVLMSSASNAQCTAGFTWSQSASNVIDFSNTSIPNVPNVTFFYWSFGDNQYDYTTNPSHTYSVPGNYVVCLSAYDSINNCQATFCDTIFVYGNVLCQTSAYATVSQSPSCASCADGSAYAMMVNGTAPYTYSWSSGGTAQTETGLAPGTYSVCITDANGCTACAQVTLSYSSSNCVAGFTWAQSANNIIDFTNTSTPNSPNSTFYNWDFGDNQFDYVQNPSHTYANPGNYFVCLTIYDSLNSCQNTFCDSVTVYGNVLPTACNAYFVVYPDSVNTNQAWAYNLSTGGPNMTFDWNWGDNTPHDFVAYPSHVYANTGTYTICLIVNDVANQCSDTMCVSLVVLRLTAAAAAAPYFVNVLPMGVHEISQVTFSIFPNPAQSEIKITSDYTLQGNDFRILDVAGRIVTSGKIEGSSIDVNLLDKGMYILQIENTKGGFTSQRFMKD